MNKPIGQCGHWTWLTFFWALSPLEEIEQVSDSLEISSHERTIIQKLALTELSEDAQQIVGLVLNDRVPVLPKTQITSQSIIKRHLQSSGWKSRRIKNAFQEISEYLKY